MAYSGGSALQTEESVAVGGWRAAVVIKNSWRRAGRPRPAGRARRPSLHPTTRHTVTILVTRDDRSLDIPVAVQHVAQHIVQTRKRRFAGNIVGAENLLLGNQTEGPAHRFWSVVEGRLQGDVRIVQAGGV